MSLTKKIQLLLEQFPALKPLGIERLLAERGFKVGRDDITTARRRLRRKLCVNRHVCEVLTHLVRSRADLYERVTAELDTLFTIVVRTATDDAELLPAQIANKLAELLDSRPPVESASARRMRIFQEVFDRFPEYRRSMELAVNLQPGKMLGCIPTGEGLDTASDEKLAAIILKYLQRNYPPGGTVEDVARTSISMNIAIEKTRREREIEQKRSALTAEQERVDRIRTMVITSFGKDLPCPDKLPDFIRCVMDRDPNWTDDEVADRVLSSLKHTTLDDGETQIETEGLRVTKRP